MRSIFSPIRRNCALISTLFGWQSQKQFPTEKLLRGLDEWFSLVTLDGLAHLVILRVLLARNIKFIFSTCMISLLYSLSSYLDQCFSQLFSWFSSCKSQCLSGTPLKYWDTDYTALLNSKYTVLWHFRYYLTHTHGVNKEQGEFVF